MSRSIPVDQGLDDHIQALLTEGCKAQAGLLLGRLGGSAKPFVLSLAPTPSAAGTPAARVGRNCGKLKVAPALLSEHARQAGPLLPGGVAVVGFFVFGPGGLPAAGNSADLLADMAAAWAGVFTTKKNKKPAVPPCLLAGWCSQTRRVVVRELAAWGEAADAVAALAAASPVSLRPTALLSTLVVASTSIRLEACVPPVRADGTADTRVAAALRRAVGVAGRRFASAAAFTSADGLPVSLDEPVGECVARLGLKAGQRLGLDLACGAACVESSEGEEEEGDSSAPPSPGSVALSGTLTALAVAGPRDSMAFLVSALAADAAASLGSRLDAAVDAARDAEADAAIAAAVPGGFSASNAAADAAEAAAADGTAPPAPCCGPAGAGATAVPGWEVTPPLLRHPAALGGRAGGPLATVLGRRGLVAGAGVLPGASDTAEDEDDAAGVVDGVAHLLLGGRRGGGATDLSVEWVEGSAPPAAAGKGSADGSAAKPKGGALSLDAAPGLLAGCPLPLVVASSAAVAVLAVGLAVVGLQ